MKKLSTMVWSRLYAACQQEEGQTTAEYALLTGAMALVLALVAAWAASTGRIGQLLDAVFLNLINAARGG
jgi:Flp pilus assembly pilin Flp